MAVCVYLVSLPFLWEQIHAVCLHAATEKSLAGVYCYLLLLFIIIVYYIKKHTQQVFLPWRILVGRGFQQDIARRMPPSAHCGCPMN